MNRLIDEFREKIKEKQLLSSNLEALQWDFETEAPKAGKELLSEIISYIAMKIYSIETSNEFVSLVEQLSLEKDKLNFLDRREVELAKEQVEKMTKIPKEEYREYRKLVSDTQGIWEEAKSKNDFSMVKDNLKKIFSFNRKFAIYLRKDETNLYDVLLNDYEKGFTCDKLDLFFSELKKEIVPFLKKIEEKKADKEVEKRSKLLEFKVDKIKQEKLGKMVANYLGFDFDKGILSQSEHPFTLNLNKNDVRITTKYMEDKPFSSVFSIIHEAGHGIYEQQTGDELINTTLGTGTSMGLHESQSRFYENIVGRNINFWNPIYKEASELYKELGDITLDDFYTGINKVESSLIRTESDELTYSLHIMVRYEIEKALINDEISVDDLPEIWKEKMKEYLGVEPETDSKGVMQDVHWYCGLIGYFPSYALGNAYASQISNTMNKDFNVNEALVSKDLEKIRVWLGDKIHKYGKLYDCKEIVKEVTGEELNPKYFIDYLKDKYSKIYNLK